MRRRKYTARERRDAWLICAIAACEYLPEYWAIAQSLGIGDRPLGLAHDAYLEASLAWWHVFGYSPHYVHAEASQILAEGGP